MSVAWAAGAGVHFVRGAQQSCEVLARLRRSPQPAIPLWGRLRAKRAVLEPPVCRSLSVVRHIHICLQLSSCTLDSTTHYAPSSSALILQPQLHHSPSTPPLTPHPQSRHSLSTPLTPCMQHNHGNLRSPPRPPV